MTPLLLIRHGPTEWTAAGRIQGRADVPLSAAGRRAVRAWRLPAELAAAAGAWDWLTSPLARARETAQLLLPAGASAHIEPALVEMHWGEWEGQRLADVRRQGGAAAAGLEARGLDFQPPGGESPRQVQARLAPFLAATAARGRPIVAVTHKGVIRAIYARAAGWDMTGPSPQRLRDACAHHFRLDASGGPRVERLNLSLVAAEAPP